MVLGILYGVFVSIAVNNVALSLHAENPICIGANVLPAADRRTEQGDAARGRTGMTFRGPALCVLYIVHLCATLWKYVWKYDEVSLCKLRNVFMGIFSVA